MLEDEVEPAGASTMHAGDWQAVAVRRPPDHRLTMLAIEIKSVDAGGAASSHSD